MNHPDLIKNHIIENWSFANAAARNATGAYVTADIGKIGYQQDTRAYWRLVSTTPTWTSVQAAFMYVMSSPVNPAGITSTAGVMAGFGILFTPVRTGNVFITVTGSASNNTANDGSKMELRYAGGTPPAFNAAATGTAIGHNVSVVNGATFGVRMGFALTGVIAGAGIGVTYWLDLALTAVTGGTVTIFDVTAVMVEI